MKPTLGICAAAALALRFFLKRKGANKEPPEEYDDETVNKALEKFNPEPLSYHIKEKDDEFRVVVNNRNGVMTTVHLDKPYYETQMKNNDGKKTFSEVQADLDRDYECVDFSSQDFLCLSTNDKVLAGASAGLGKYGPGACGPRGFYGSLDIFIQLENELAKFLGFQSCALYSYELLLFPSVIPTLITKKKQPMIAPIIVHRTMCGDKIIDNYKAPVPHTIVNGCKLGYGTLVEVDINIDINLNDLSTVSVNLKPLVDKCEENPGSWILIDTGKHGITFSVLEDICKIAHEHNCYVCADCTNLKETYLGIEKGPKLPADVVLVGLATGFGGVGGAVLSTKEIIDRQRLGGKGYVFSAAPPPPSICGVLVSLDILKEDSGINIVANSTKNMKNFLSVVSNSDSCYIIDYTEGSSLVTLGLKRDDKLKKDMRQICETLMAKGFLVNPLDYDKLEILVCIKSEMTNEQIRDFVLALK